MKTTFGKWSLGLAMAVLPLAGGCDQESANSAPNPPPLTNTNASSGSALAAVTNAPSPEAAEAELEQAPGQVVSTPSAPPANANLSGPALDVMKLAQAGLDESVMLSFVTNSTHTFNLSSDAIIYLNDIGVPGAVVTAMIQHDQALKETSANYAGTTPNPNAQTPYPAPETQQATEAPPNQGADTGQAPPPAEVSYNSFYGSLAPYGNWISVEGYGWCWQPTVVVDNPGWQPYCDRGHWAYTDCGWCWVSDYSWGWAPFHYGRWFHHNRWGWCWAPDTVWGPAWVSWRYDHNHCGWAPLPPTACYAPGIGFTYLGHRVGFNFTFGLSANLFTFVDLGHFTDRQWHRHRIPAGQVREFFDHSRVANRMSDHKGVVVNEGIPVSRVEVAEHRRITRLATLDAKDPASAHFGRVDRPGAGLAVYRPKLQAPMHPTPLVGQGLHPTEAFGSPKGHTAVIPVAPHPVERGPVNTPIFRNSPATAKAPPIAPGTEPLVHRGYERPAIPTANRPVASQKPVQSVPNRATPPVSYGRPGQNSSSVILRNQPESTIRAQSPAPIVTKPQETAPRVFRQQAPKYNQPYNPPDRPAYTQPRAPVVQAPAPQYHWAPAAEPREQQHWSAPVEHSAPVFRGQTQSAPPPVERSASPPPSSYGGNRGNDSNSRRK